MSTFRDIITSLPFLRQHHSHTDSIYRVYDRVARLEAEKLFSHNNLDERNLEPLGNIRFPYFKMGAVDSIDLFGLDELIIFSFYWVNRNRYRKALDIGANIGLHSLILAKLGYQVRMFEPDPIHYNKLMEIVQSNNLQNVEGTKAAVSNQFGETEFVRVLGNTTSSHIAGSKQPYGELETIKVPIYDIRSLMRDYDLIKMDAEGHEATIISATQSSDWDTTDAMIEVGSSKAAAAIFQHLNPFQVRLFSQKTGWNEVKRIEQMPNSYKEGSLFLSKKESMPWGDEIKT